MENQTSSVVVTKLSWFNLFFGADLRSIVFYRFNYKYNFRKLQACFWFQLKMRIRTFFKVLKVKNS